MLLPNKEGLCFSKRLASVNTKTCKNTVLLIDTFHLSETNTLSIIKDLENNIFLLLAFSQFFENGLDGQGDKGIEQC